MQQQRPEFARCNSSSNRIERIQLRGIQLVFGREESVEVGQMKIGRTLLSRGLMNLVSVSAVISRIVEA